MRIAKKAGGPPKAGKPYVLTLTLLFFFIVIPVTTALILCLNTLGRAGEQSKNTLAIALRSQIEYSQILNPSRQNSSQRDALRAESELFTELGNQETLGPGRALFRALAILRTLENSAPPELSNWYIYFVKSDYLMGTKSYREDARSYADSRILPIIAEIDASDMNHSCNRYGLGEEGRYFSAYTAVVVPGVIYIFTRAFAEGERPSPRLAESITGELEELEIAYYDSFGNYHAATEKQDLIKLFDFDSLGSDDTGTLSFRHEGHRYLYFYIYNPDNNTKYVVFCRDEIGEEQQLIANLLWIWAGCIITLFLALAIYFAGRTYRPMEELVSRLPRPENASGVLRDDYRLLENALDSMSTMDFKYREQRSLLEKTCLLHLFRHPDTDVFEGHLDDWVAENADRSFAVVAFYFDAVRQDEPAPEPDFEAQTLKFFAERGYAPQSVWEGGHLLVAFRMADKSIEELSGDCSRYIESQDSFILSLYISDIHHGARELHKCYSEAMAVAEHCMALEKYGTILSFGAAREAIGHNDGAWLDLSQFQRLCDGMATLSVDDTMTQFDRIAARLREEKNTFPEHESMAFFLLVNTVTISFYDIGLAAGLGKDTLFDRIEQIRAAQSPGELRQRLREALEFVIQSGEQGFSAECFEKIRQYVEKNIQNPNLSAGLVADLFDTSRPGITRMFKKYQQSGFLEFIHQLRVAQAVRLLEETGMTVADIAVQVGYTNTVTLTRAFKKYANTTPGAVRRR